MAASTRLMSFHVGRNLVDRKTIKQELENILKQFGFSTLVGFHDFGEGNGFILVLANQYFGHASLRWYESGLLTVNIEEMGASLEKNKPNGQPEDHLILEELEKQLKECTHSQKSKKLPAIRQGGQIDPYYPTTDNHLIEYDFDQCVYEVDSPYQNIKIMHSQQYGNVLILDNDINLAESDLAYTEAITGNGREDFRDKDILILGGGDGGILNQLLKKSPKFVTMLEIDQLVIDGAVKHLRGICGDSMDSLKGENYWVRVEDCVPVLEEYIRKGQTFSYIINDLTAIPITLQPRGSQWEFLHLILDLSLKVLDSNGKYFTQGNGANAVSALKMYEDQISKLSIPVDFQKETVCVPSYHEQWVFYEIWKKNSQY